MPAHSIKNPDKIHYIIKHNNRIRYICIGACSVTKSKSTKDIHEVTCKNCKREIERMKKK